MYIIKNFILGLSNKIAFYPTIISLAGVLLSFIMIILENQGLSSYLNEIAPGLVINDTETARTVLSALISGLISLTVFSFSMVMVLLNQASTNFSPRVLPGLISNKKHQIVLGLYLGVILYNIFSLIFIEPTKTKYQTPGFQVLVGIVLTIACLGSFIYFIHSISESIQVNNILKRLYLDSKKQLLSIIEKEKGVEENPDTSEWKAYYAKESGYLQGFIQDGLLSICKEEQIKIYIPYPEGKYIQRQTVAFLSNSSLEDSVVEKILNLFIYNDDELASRNHIYGFKQITEIAVKAMSPGINDPGTANNAIDYLNDLFIVLLRRKSKFNTFKNDEKTYIWQKIVSTQQVLYYVMASLRQYSKHDLTIVEKMALLLKSLYDISDEKHQKEFLLEEIKTLEEDAQSSIENERDKKIALKHLGQL